MEFGSKRGGFNIQHPGGRDMSQQPPGREYSFKGSSGETPEPRVREAFTYAHTEYSDSYVRFFMGGIAFVLEVPADLEAREVQTSHELREYPAHGAAFLAHDTGITVDGGSAVGHQPQTPDGSPAFGSHAPGEAPSFDPSANNA